MELDLKLNNISAISDKTFEFSPRLKKINLRGNKLGQIHSLFHILQPLLARNTLENLDLADNQLTYLEEELIEITSLQTIALNSPKFLCIPEYLNTKFRSKIVNGFPQGDLCRCPGILLENIVHKKNLYNCGQWKIVQNHCEGEGENQHCYKYLEHKGYSAQITQTNMIENSKTETYSTQTVTIKEGEETATITDEQRRDGFEVQGTKFLVDVDMSLGLTSMDSLNLTGLDDIEYIDLSNNNITVLPSTFIRKFPNLKVLNVNYNYIFKLMPNVFKNSALQKLFFDYNYINSIPVALFPISMIEISIKNNRLENRIPENLFKTLPQLTSLNLGGNLISLLPDDFLEESNDIEDVFLNDNKLTGFDADMFQGKRLLTLDLSGNDIKLIHTSQFAAINHITMLDLSNNKLSGLPNHIFGPSTSLPDLAEFVFNNNNMYNIGPYFLAAANNLQVLSFHNNKISSLHSPIMQTFKDLNELDISNNQIQILSQNFVPPSHNLQQLTAHSNPLIRIEPDTFTQVPKLVTLDLSKTYMTEIDASVFHGLDLLQTLLLQHGILKKLQPGQFAHLVNLETLYVSFVFVKLYLCSVCSWNHWIV